MFKGKYPKHREKGRNTMTKTMQKKTFVKGMFIVGNARGLHTRPSVELVKCATTFKSEIRLTYQKNQINAKSLLGILMLAVTKGGKIWIEALGEDAEEAVETLLALAKNNFNIKY
jgi:phosphocarrier protein